MKGNIFIKRPVMAISISILILAIGLISLFTLPVEQYPDIAPPTVHVSATYTGADADAVMNSVIMPLEESTNGVENMMYMTSTSTNAGSATIEVYFKQGTDPDMASTLYMLLFTRCATSNASRHFKSPLAMGRDAFKSKHASSVSISGVIDTRVNSN